MPPAKVRSTLQHEDSRSETSARDRQPGIIPRKSKAAVVNTTSNVRDNGSALKELALISTESGEVIIPGSSTGMNWSSSPLNMLDNYRIAYGIQSSAAFTSPLNQALLTNPGIGRQSPTMARRKEYRRVAKGQLATGVRKHFNGAAVSETDVVVEFTYKVKNKGKAFRMRSAPTGNKK